MLNIDNLTVGELKELAKMASTLLGGCAGEKASTFVSPNIGKYCLIRTYSAGVHAGEVVQHDGDIVVLKNARRLWSWTAKQGIALSGVAAHGIKAGKVDEMLPEHTLIGVIEIMTCSEAAKVTIHGA